MVFRYSSPRKLICHPLRPNPGITSSEKLPWWPSRPSTLVFLSTSRVPCPAGTCPPDSQLRVSSPHTVHGTREVATYVNRVEPKESRPPLEGSHLPTRSPALLHVCAPALCSFPHSFPSRQPRMISVLSWVLFLLCVCVLIHHIEMQTARG